MAWGGLAYQAQRDNVTHCFSINQRVVGLRFFTTFKTLIQLTAYLIETI